MEDQTFLEDMPLSSWEQRLEELRKATAVQCTDGTWDYAPYMLGLANGLILAEHIMAGREGTPCFRSAPQVWLKEVEQAIHPARGCSRTTPLVISL